MADVTARYWAITGWWMALIVSLVRCDHGEPRYDLGAIHPATGERRCAEPCLLPDYADITIPKEQPFLDVQVRAIVEIVDDRAVPLLCGGPALACAMPARQTIVVPNPCLYPRDTYARILCHEKAHLAGWQTDPSHNATQ